MSSLIRGALPVFTRAIPSTTRRLICSGSKKWNLLPKDRPSSVTIRSWNAQKEVVRQDYCNKIQEITRQKLGQKPNPSSTTDKPHQGRP